MNLKTLSQGSRTPCDETTTQECLPPWLDKEKFKRGQQFYLRHMMVCSLAMHYSLVAGFSIASLLKALVFTNQSDTPSKSIKRYLNTALHIYLWHKGDVWEDCEDPAYKSLREVRNMHFRVSKDMKKRSTNNSGGSAFNRVGRPTTSNLVTPEDEPHFSQYNMAVVLVGFMGLVVMYPTKLGISVTRDELDDYVHFWRGIGYILGIKDEFNICKGTYEETVNICKEIEDEVLLPSLRMEIPDFDMMADAYCKGVNGFLNMPLYSKEAIIAFVLDLMGKPALWSLSWPDWIRYWIYKVQKWCFRWIPCLELLLSRKANRNFDLFSKLSTLERNGIFRLIMDKIENNSKKTH